MEDVVAFTERTLAARPPRAPDFEVENRALLALADVLAEQPTEILNYLCALIMEVFGAGSAGVSLLSTDAAGDEVFFWPAVAGAWAPHVGGVMPRDASPCGVVVDRKASLIYQHPEQVFPAAGLIDPAIVEILLYPFFKGGEAIGTIWVISHDQARKFDGEDRRMLASLSRFVSMAQERLRTETALLESRERLDTALSEARASEQQFRDLAQTLPNHAWTALPDGQLDWFNDRVYEFSGAESGSLHGSGWTQLVHPDDLSAAGASWARALNTAQPYETEFRLRRSDGSYRWHLARAAPVLGADGAAVRWIGANTDIEDQKAAVAALADLNATLEARVDRRTAELMVAEESLRQSQKMDAVGQLTGGIAHDFNNMLTGVLGSLDLLRRRIEAGRYDETQRFLTAAALSAERAAALTHRLLAFARRQSLDTRSSNVGGLVTGMQDLLLRTLGESVHLEFRIDDDIWPAMTDANQFESALLNLAINARDAMPDGGKLTIEAGNLRVDRPHLRSRDSLEVGEYVVVAVSDTGQGMAAEVIERAFDPFFTTKPIGQGTGLGLSMVYGFIKQTGGHVRIYSEPGQGTTVKLFLRRGMQDAAGEAASVLVAAPRGHGESVLVVEDDETVRLLMIEVLDELGYAHVQAGDAREALPILESDLPIDLMITDVGLPGGVNGRQLAELARARRPDLKILFVTGYAETAAVRGGFLDAGMEMMTKPFPLDGLAARIRSLIAS